MARALERRIKKLEQAASGLPCKKPEHNDLLLFVMKRDQEAPDAETQAKIDSIRACAKCKDKLVVIFMNFGTDPEQPAEAKPKSFDLVYGEDRSKSPRVVPAQWLNGCLIIGDN